MPEAKSPRGKTKTAKTRPAATMPTDSPVGGRNADTPPAFRGRAAQASARAKKLAKEPGETPNAVTAEAGDLIKHICSAAAGGAQAYNANVLEFARANGVSALDFARQLSIVSSPLEFMKLSIEYNRKQLATLASQAKALAAIALKLTPDASPREAAFKSAGPGPTGADCP
jgi:hypothetical protein